MITNQKQATQGLNNLALLQRHCEVLTNHPQTEELLAESCVLLEVTDAFLLEWSGEEALFQTLSEGLVENIRYTYHLLGRYQQEENWVDFQKKVEFQLYPFLKTLSACLYFLCFIKGDKEKEKEFTKNEQNKWFASEKQDRYLEEKQYPYTASIVILAYNQLEYTKKCVEAVLRQTPSTLNYQLILVNNGSSDGTREYFQSFPQGIHLDIKKNDLMFTMKCLPFLYEGEYTCYISNDVVVGANYLENMITCMESDPAVRYIVPTTPNIAGGQTIDHPDYGDDMEKMTVFSKKNNHSNKKRWEQKVRLCNPIALYRSADVASSQSILEPPLAFSVSGVGFGDDFISHRVRQHGGKNILAKDAFCHHFGSVTLKHEPNYLTEKHVQGKRESFKEYTGIDPYERGCHSYQGIRDRLEKHHQGEIFLLAINSRLSTTALELKELIRSEKNVKSCALHLVAEEPVFVKEMQSIGDEVLLYEGVSWLSDWIGERKYHYILLEESLVNPTHEKDVVALLQQSLVKNGSLFVKQPKKESLSTEKDWESFKVPQEPERILLPWSRFKYREKR